MSKKPQATTRVLQELRETAVELSEYGLVSEADMKRMKALCEAQPERGRPSARLHGKRTA